jgi:hypothetical protein
MIPHHLQFEGTALLALNASKFPFPLKPVGLWRKACITSGTLGNASQANLHPLPVPADRRRIGHCAMGLVEVPEQLASTAHGAQGVQPAAAREMLRGRAGMGRKRGGGAGKLKGFASPI